PADAGQQALRGRVDQWLDRVGREVGVHVAVGQGEAADASRVARREDLDDRAAAVVADDVHLLQSHALAERLEHLGLAGGAAGGVRVAPWPSRSTAMQRRVSATRSTTWRQRSWFRNTPWTKSAAGPRPRSA